MAFPCHRKDYEFLQRITTETKTQGLQNAVIFGRRTWEFLIREEGRKYANRFNVVLTSKPPGDIPPGADLVCTSLQGALDRLQTPPLSHHIQQVFILGGRRLYEEAMRHEMCDRLYVTVLDGVFPADIYHPHIDHTLFTSITSLLYYLDGVSLLLHHIPATFQMRLDHIAVGYGHALALADEGMVFSWGVGSRGQLGHGDREMKRSPLIIESVKGKRIVR
jgi:dihydrofolate reductase